MRTIPNFHSRQEIKSNFCTDILIVNGQKVIYITKETTIFNASQTGRLVKTGQMGWFLLELTDLYVAESREGHDQFLRESVSYAVVTQRGPGKEEKKNTIIHLHNFPRLELLPMLPETPVELINLPASCDGYLFKQDSGLLKKWQRR